MKYFLIAATLLASQASAAPLKVGVTLHPYYSWAANVVAGTDVEVRSILPGDVDAGNYQPRPEDVKKLADLDAIIVNGIGHDDFIRQMIKASGNKKLKVINTNDGAPLIKAKNGGTVNSHTFISFTNAIQQTYLIEKALSVLRPELAAKFKQNASDYARRLRAIKARAASELAQAKETRLVTVHDGYVYFLQELGLENTAVVEPAHGLVPSAGELGEMVKILQRDHLKVVLSEEGFPEPLLKVLKDSAGARVYVISHVASGDYTADKFEKEMSANVDTVIRAVVKDPAP